MTRRFRIKETPAKLSSCVAVQVSMVRLGRNFVWRVLLATAVTGSGVVALAQTAATTATPAAAKGTPTPTAATQSQPKASTKARSHRKTKPALAESTPAAPAPPPTLEQQSPAAPQVTYRNGQLTINAPNSTLASILRAVQQQTGASVDVPSAASNDRVAMMLGPGQPRDVMNALLHGSKFDYVILGVSGQPGAIQKVILTPRQAGATSSAQAAPPPQPAAQDEADDNSSVAETSGESEYPGPSPDQPPQPMPPGAFRRPMGAPGGQMYQQQQMSPDQNAFGQSDPNVVKTPEQLMQELQQMQQQQQQYQEQLNPANQNPQ